jgi:Protein of unknown function (DUF3168)
MSDPSYELQQALYTALKNNIGPEVGPRVFDNVPSNAQFPYVTLGDGQVLPDKADCIDGTEHFPQIDVWSRAVGYPEAKTISKNILAVLDDKPLPMPGYVAVIFELENIQYLRDPDGLTRHVALIFHTRIEAA